MQIQVERSERLASIGRLAAGIAHEIRNPLASISGSVEMLRGLPGAEGEARQLVDIAVREVDRLNGLITELLDYARPRAEEKQTFDLAEIASEIAKAFEHERREHDVHIEVKAEPGGRRSRGRPGRSARCCGTCCATPPRPCPRGGTIQHGGHARGAPRGGRPGPLLSVRGHRRGHRARGHPPHLRAVLLAQARRHRPGPGDGGPHRRGPPGPHRESTARRAAAPSSRCGFPTFMSRPGPPGCTARWAEQ